MLQSIEIRNWKGHNELKLSFIEGVNFIVGPNGIGKSSILDAICFAILGDIETTSVYKNLTYRDLIRDPVKDMEIALSFNAQGKGRCTVKRSHSAKNNRKSSTLFMNGKVLEKSWDQVTSRILDLYDTNDLFFRRVAVLSEGDTFSYSTQPPGDGLTKHIENVLGIDRMERLRTDLKALRKEFKNEAVGYKSEVKQMKELTEAEKIRFKNLTNEFEQLKIERKTFFEKTESVNKKIGALELDEKRADDLISKAKAVIDEWEKAFGDPPENYEFIGAIQTLLASLRDKRNDLNKERDSQRDEIAWVASQIDSQRRILDLVTPLEKEYKEVGCPVCKRPLTPDMVKEIKDECLHNLEDLEKRKNDKQAQIPIFDDRMKKNEGKLQKLLSIDSKVKALIENEPKSCKIDILEAHKAKIIDQENSMKADLEKLKDQTAKIDDKISIIERELSELRKKADASARQSIISSLVRATKGHYVCDLFNESLESALSEQRNALLGPLVEELSGIWSVFLGTEVGVNLMEDAQIRIIDKQSGNTFEFPQISGGEKTALLIFTQICLSKYFSRADFMMLDEPLEHLDAKNRWALIKFIVDSTKSGYPKQVIVNTFEETLLREYLDDAKIKVNFLSKDYPIIDEF
jgi:exonuclease SbcC